MLQVQKGNPFLHPAECLVNTVNCVGVMGKGIALAFKKRFPEIMPPYQAACRSGELRPGKNLFLRAHDGTWIACFPTKDDWRKPSELAYIEAGLPDLVSGLRERNIASVSIPALGCSNGGLAFSDVRPLVEKAFAEEDGIDAVLFEPSGPEHDDDPILTFGPYKGKRLSSLPDNQLRWLSQNAFTANLKSRAATFLAEREAARKQAKPGR